MKLELDEPVVMVEGHRGSTPLHGKVVKIGRVWIEILPEGWAVSRARRYRLDTQTNGSELGSPRRFYTLGQWAERERLMVACEFLRRQGISINTGSPWRNREVELADLLGSGRAIEQASKEEQ